MTLPTEPLGSIPRPAQLIEGMKAASEGRLSGEKLEALFDDAVRDTIRRFEETGSPVITDGEQRKPSFATYPINGAKNLASGGVTIPFKDEGRELLRSALEREGPAAMASKALGV